jgi:hypothetical protein
VRREYLDKKGVPIRSAVCLTFGGTNQRVEMEKVSGSISIVEVDLDLIEAHFEK